ncbi:uncharacterized protein LOC141680349 [Apium graveolens]|uniref:uncharacterized protein LOC141680349 n=1 Tax=Apium graveolens TaxID=4045 RepID=UPI003D7BF79F
MKQNSEMLYYVNSAQAKALFKNSQLSGHLNKHYKKSNESQEINVVKCSGVCTEGDHENDEVVYYGILIEILELSFSFDRKVYLFRCKWYNSNPKSRSIYVDNNLTSINTSTDWYYNEPFILATQAQQAFYLLDATRGSNWRFVQKVNHQFVYDIPEIAEVVSEPQSNGVLQEEESFQLPPFQPVEDLIESSSLVRRDVASVILSTEIVGDLFSSKGKQPIGEEADEDEVELNEEDDDGHIFFKDHEVPCSGDDNSETTSETEYES